MNAHLLSGALICLLGSAVLPAQTFQSGPAATSLIELYTSEGCSSCPPAEQWLTELKNDPGLWTRFVPVSFHVNYWDNLGWPDIYARPAYTARQRAYAADWGTGNIYTPEFVRQGREWRPGESTPKPAFPGVLTVQRNDDGSGTVVYRPAVQSTIKTFNVSVAWLGGDVLIKVRAGENSGRTLAHDFIALHVVLIPLAPSGEGDFAGAFAPPPSDLPATGKHALAAWISTSGETAPLQATGGWLD
jgi:hypothetical protein